MDKERPRGREKNVTGNSTGVHKRGDGLGTGPVGSPNGYGNAGRDNGRPGGTSNFGGFGNNAGGFGNINPGNYGNFTGNNNHGANNSGSNNTGSNPFMTRATKAGGGGLGLIVIVIVLIKLFGGGSLGNILGSFLGGGTAEPETSVQTQESPLQGIAEMLGGGASPFSSGSSSSANATQTSYSSVDTTVASGSRNKYTRIAGAGSDKVTIMVYMCGTDLESQSGMASSDLNEMASANFGSNINLIVYTGGCSRWKINGISNSTNQIYQVEGGKLKQLVKSDGKKAMTDPDTLSAFIKWGAQNFPANRYELIFWDHGGGSVSGYGYDENFPRSGSMSIANIDKALKAGGIKFDFIGFDACLMATAETALMLNNHADYMIASEETEPGIGWYYTNWLTKFGANTSMPTVEIGKNIVDDFVSKCATQCRGQQTTLSVVDLAEFAHTVPSKLTTFSKSLSSMITTNNYKTVSDARYQTREFARSTKIDQIDLVDLCNNIGNSESKALAQALQGAIKYNRTSTNMTNAYGISIYFPYQRTSNVDKACDIYDDIGLDDSYADCIKQFASLEVGGQVAAGGTASPVGSLFDLLGGGMSGGSSGGGSSDAIGALLNSFLGSGGASTLISGLGSGNMGFLTGKSISTKAAADYIAQNNFDASRLRWKKSGSKYLLSLPESQWNLIHGLDLNMFYDDGKGYIDLGLDNVYDWTEDGSLIAETDRTWLAINGQPVAYYHVDTTEFGDQYTITGRVPAMLNGKRVNIWLVFDNENPNGYISGAQSDYQDATDAVAKNMTELKKGDKIDFLCDYYSYSGEYQDSYYLGEQMIYNGNAQISNVDVGSGKVRIMYRFTDIYNQEYWTENIKL